VYTGVGKNNTHSGAAAGWGQYNKASRNSEREGRWGTGVSSGLDILSSTEANNERVKKRRIGRIRKAADRSIHDGAAVKKALGNEEGAKREKIAPSHSIQSQRKERKVVQLGTKALV